MSKSTPGVRYSEVERDGASARVQVLLDIDGGVRQDVSTGIHFLDHMLTELAFHGLMNLGLSAEGDLEVDDHHTVVEVGLALGEALGECLGAEDGIVRFASTTVACEDALVQVSIDARGRGGYFSNLKLDRDRLGGVSGQSIPEFFRALAMASGITLHLSKLAGVNDHHVCEASFKALGLALHQAADRTIRNISSATKGSRG